MTTNIQIGDDILCINDEGVQEHGIHYGQLYVANQVTDIPGQGEFLGVHSPELGKIIITDASRFEKAHTLPFRIYKESSQYVLIDENFVEEEHKDKGEEYIDIKLTVPESKLDEIDLMLAHVLEKVSLQGLENEAPD